VASTKAVVTATVTTLYKESEAQLTGRGVQTAAMCCSVQALTARPSVQWNHGDGLRPRNHVSKASPIQLPLQLTPSAKQATRHATQGMPAHYDAAGQETRH
jgi:hypothetical protein